MFNFTIMFIFITFFTEHYKAEYSASRVVLQVKRSNIDVILWRGDFLNSFSEKKT